mgnify:CR=1 FL=1
MLYFCMPPASAHSHAQEQTAQQLSCRTAARKPRLAHHVGQHLPEAAGLTLPLKQAQDVALTHGAVQNSSCRGVGGVGGGNGERTSLRRGKRRWAGRRLGRARQAGRLLPVAGAERRAARAGWRRARDSPLDVTDDGTSRVVDELDAHLGHVTGISGAADD